MMGKKIKIKAPAPGTATVIYNTGDELITKSDCELIEKEPKTVIRVAEDPFIDFALPLGAKLTDSVALYPGEVIGDEANGVALFYKDENNTNTLLTKACVIGTEENPLGLFIPFTADEPTLLEVADVMTGIYNSRVKEIEE